MRVVLGGTLLGVLAVGCSTAPGSRPGAVGEEVAGARVAPSAAEAEVGAGPGGDAGAGPSTVVDGVPMGYRPDAQGAEAAAREFVRATASMVTMEPEAAVAAQRVMAASAAEEDLVARRSAELQNIWGSAGREDLSYWYTPIASRGSMSGAQEALAEVWYVGVLRSSLKPGLQTWRTASFRLVWEDDDWRVDQQSEVVGPVPTSPLSEAPTSTSAEMNSLLEGFEPAWAGARR
ncbi:MAG: hypothetical protein ACR2LA_11255 [Acidimicrobiales bacterium]